MFICIVKVFVILKCSIVIVNNCLGNLDNEKIEVIIVVCDEIFEGNYDDNFLFVVW